MFLFNDFGVFGWCLCFLGGDGQGRFDCCSLVCLWMLRFG